MDRPANHDDALAEVLEQYWGFDTFRPLQREAIDSVLAGRDSLVILPTGGGKSLCYQAPALAMPGVAIIVSPLISLMKDQVDALKLSGAPAAFINSSLSSEERRKVLQQVRTGEIKLLYAAPERLVRPQTLNFLRSVDVSFVAIDEAHCVSTWGHDFRPEYTELSLLKQALPGVAVHAYTATAAERVRQDITQGLALRDPQMLIGPFDRPNLVFRVRRATRKLDQVQEVIDRHPGESGIVYCISRNEVESVAASLKSAGVRAAPYHAGLGDTARARNQEAFLKDRIDVIVATVAFGMGIDKPDVRFVVHAGMPKSLEAYVQESGRAGRDGLESECLLLYKGSDAVLWRRMIEEGEPAALEGALRSLGEMMRYTTSVGCRHQAIVEHFGQSLDRHNCGACDYCLDELSFADEPLINAQKIISCVARLEQRFGASHTAKVLAGSKDQNVTRFNHTTLSTYGILKHEHGTTIRDWIEQLVGQGHLAKVGEYGVLQITTSGREVLRGETTPQLLAPAKRVKESRARTKEDWEGVDRGLFDALKELRGELAAEKTVPAYMVFGDQSLRDMARRRPTSEEAFARVRGVGAAKLRDYGQVFIGAITNYCSEMGVPTDVME
ncbi:DNA helicase RecQ [Aeoliella mucimassa]|uniref:DNA helicase RecQ n=1 Tax=Aeoliella mucimassa TaxID=2527972 RepID=A0A518AKB2_9BACT|nr:DNA helicase RecQ [Aeoliella mucimassa]QDU55171.1 ATP-dependent DNA helicase RecQ [Aeoliella mucimassa]